MIETPVEILKYDDFSTCTGLVYIIGSNGATIATRLEPEMAAELVGAVNSAAALKAQNKRLRKLLKERRSM